MQWLAIAIGGSIGAMARFAVNIYTFPMFGTRFPLGTLTVNVLGCFLVGICYVLILEKGIIAADWRNILMTGFLGAFTTFSTFALEAVTLWQSGHASIAVMYILLNFVLSIVAVVAAIELTQLLV